MVGGFPSPPLPPLPLSDVFGLVAINALHATRLINRNAYTVLSTICFLSGKYVAGEEEVVALDGDKSRTGTHAPMHTRTTTFNLALGLITDLTLVQLKSTPPISSSTSRMAGFTNFSSENNGAGGGSVKRKVAMLLGKSKRVAQSGGGGRGRGDKEGGRGGRGGGGRGGGGRGGRGGSDRESSSGRGRGGKTKGGGGRGGGHQGRR